MRAGRRSRRVCSTTISRTVFTSGTLGALATAAPAFVITKNYVEDFQHPFVGLVTSYRERLMAQSGLANLRSHLTDGFNAQTSGNGSSRGGTCSGDSGGPVFYGFSSNTIVAVTSFGLNPYCRGAGFSCLTDRRAVIDWIL